MTGIAVISGGDAAFGRLGTLAAVIFLFILIMPGAFAVEEGKKNGAELDINDEFTDEEMGAAAKPPMKDPLERLNRPIFRFNDRLYMYGMLPLAKAYRKTVNRHLRRSIGNFFHNLSFPVRLCGNLLQFKGKGVMRESSRFIINTSVGLGGLFDPAKSVWKLDGSEEDLGQTMGRWGIRPGCYIVWPVLGPSSPRDTIGMIGDGFVSPRNYLLPHDWEWRLGVTALDQVNSASSKAGQYESIRGDAFDPYLYFRDAYWQNREKQVKE